jgi:serine/threonine-protein kinase
MLVEHVALDGCQASAGALVRAAHAFQNIRHPNVVLFDQLILSTGQFAAAGPYVEVVSLKAMLLTARVQGIGFTVQAVGRVLFEALEGLATVHEHCAGACGGLVPDQLLLSTDGSVRVGAVPVSAVAGAVPPWLSDSERVTYLAPEQFNGDSADERADVYSAGLIAVELLANRKLFAGSAARIADTVKRGSGAPMSALAGVGLPSQLVEVLECATAVNRSERFSSLREFRAALGAIPDVLARPAEVAALVETAAGRQLAVMREHIAGNGRASHRPPPPSMSEITASVKPRSLRGQMSDPPSSNPKAVGATHKTPVPSFAPVSAPRARRDTPGLAPAPAVPTARSLETTPRWLLALTASLFLTNLALIVFR